MQQCQIFFQLVALRDPRGSRRTREMFHVSGQSGNQRWKRRHSTLSPYLRAGHLHICGNIGNHGHDGEVRLFPQAKTLALGPVGVQRCTIPWCHLLRLRQELQGPAGFLQAGSDCSKPPLLAAAAAEGCYQTNAGKNPKTWKLSVITQPFLQRSGGVMGFQAKQKACCLLCPTWSSAARLKGTGFEEGFSEKWITRKNVGDQPATSGERGWDLALGYLTFLLDLHGLLFSVNS